MTEGRTPHDIGLRGRAVLMVAHCAGMLDLVALPVWVGVLIGRLGFDPQQAGMVVTLFLAGAVVASLLLATRLPHLRGLRGRWLAASGFGAAAACFAVASSHSGFGAMAALHALAGLCVGAALSVTHGTIARSARPHRLFAMAGLALGVFAILFLGATPPLVAARGGPVLFGVFAAVMALAALMSLLAFPPADAHAPPMPLDRTRAPAAGRIDPSVWFGVVGISAMALVQSMTFSFLERVGQERGFGSDAINAVLVALGVVNLLPAVLAALLERRWPAQRVMLAGPVLQAGLVLVIMQSGSFVPYAVAASMFAAVMIFTHTFAFGLLARLDTSGRALAATPAMLMTGAAIGPVLGGTLVKAFGYGSLGAAALAIACVAVAAFWCVQQRRPLAAPPAAAAAEAGPR